MSPELATYRRHVQKLATERRGTPVFNGSIEHAAILVEQMFAHAHDKVGILTGKLNARVYGTREVLEQIKLFLADDEHKLRILLEDLSTNNLRDHPFFDEFGYHQNVEIRGVPSHVSENTKFHFLVMDDDSYRFEPDKSTQEATGAFGNKEAGKHLNTLFDMLWGISTPMSVPPKHTEPARVAQTA